MTTAKSATSKATAFREPTPAEALAGLQESEKPKISPAERWLKIREKACLRAQRHGFVGGNPLDDWSAAEKEVDAKYETDPDGPSLTTSERITSEIKCVLSRYGLDDLSVDALLESHQQAMEKLAALDRTLIDSTAELANQQTALAQEALHEAANTLQSMAQGRLDMDAITKQSSLSMQAMENALSHLRAIAAAVAGLSSGSEKTNSSKDASSKDTSSNS